MANEGRASHAIIMKLIEQKDYKAAEDIVSGAANVISLCKTNLQYAVILAESVPNEANLLSLKTLLEKSEVEVKLHRNWEASIKAQIPQTDLANGAARPIMRRFEETSSERDALSDEIDSLRKKYFP